MAGDIIFETDDGRETGNPENQDLVASIGSGATIIQHILQSVDIFNTPYTESEILRNAVAPV